MNIDFPTRFAIAEEYLALAIGLPGRSWTRMASRALKAQDLPLALALLHPDNLGLREISYRESRIFSGQFQLPGQHCEAARFWGVTCVETHQLQADHDWPWSLGGPPATQI